LVDQRLGDSSRERLTIQGKTITPITITENTIQTALGEVFDLSAMTGWQVVRLSRQLTAEVAMYGHDVAKRDWLRDQRDKVDAVIRRKCY